MVCSAHQTPAQLYQPAWGYHGLSFRSQTLNHLQMLWHVPGLGPSRRQWGCVRTVAVYLQEEWTVEREDNWLVDALVQDTQWAYYCTIVQIQNLIWNVEHIHVNSFPIVVRLYHCQPVWTNPTTIKFIQHNLIRDTYCTVTSLAEYNHRTFSQYIKET